MRLHLKLRSPSYLRRSKWAWAAGHGCRWQAGRRMARRCSVPTAPRSCCTRHAGVRRRGAGPYPFTEQAASLGLHSALPCPALVPLHRMLNTPDCAAPQTCLGRPWIAWACLWASSWRTCAGGGAAGRDAVVPLAVVLQQRPHPGRARLLATFRACLTALCAPASSRAQPA